MHWRHLTAASFPLAVCSALCSALLLGACGRKPAPLSVPISNWPGYEYFYLASKLGIDKGYGLEIQPIQYPDPQVIVHAYLQGSISVAQLTTVEVVDLCARDPRRCPEVVLVLNESRGGDRIAAARSIASLDQLRGKDVAVTYSTLGPYVLSRALDSVGLQLRDVTLRNIPLSTMPDALRTGQVQAAVFFPPFSDYAARDGQSHVLFDSRSLPGEVFDVLAVDPAYLRDHADQVVQLVSVWAQAHRQAKREPQRALALMARREQVSVQEFRESEQGLVYFDLNQQRDLLKPGGVISRNLARVLAVQRQLGLTPPGAPLPVVSSRYVEAAS